MFTRLHSSTNQELFEKYVCNHSSHYEKYDGAVCPSYCLRPKHPLPFCQLCLICYTAVQIKNCLKSTSVIKVVTMKSTDDFLSCKGSHHVATTKLTFFTVSKDKWNTKEDTGKSLKNTLHVLRCTSRAEATSNSEKIKPVALAVI